MTKATCTGCGCSKTRIALLVVAAVFGGVAVLNYYAVLKPRMEESARIESMEKYTAEYKIKPEEVKAVRALLDRAGLLAKEEVLANPPKTVQEQVSREIAYMDQFAAMLEEAKKSGDYLTPRESVTLHCARWGETIKFGATFPEEELTAEKLLKKDLASESMWKLKAVQESLEWGGDAMLLAMMGRWALDEASGTMALSKNARDEFAARLEEQKATAPVTTPPAAEPEENVKEEAGK